MAFLFVFENINSSTYLPLENFQIPDVPVMPKIVRLPPVQVVQPVAPVIPPQGVIGQPRTSQQNRVRGEVYSGGVKIEQVPKDLFNNLLFTGKRRLPFL